MLSYDVLCIGSGTVDTFLTITQSFASVRPGDKILVHSSEVHSGGGATNAACALSKLGLNTKVLTKLGRDHNAGFVLEDLKRYQVKNICMHRSDKNTDAATIISSTEEKDRIIYVHKGASDDLQTTDYKKYQLRAQWIYLASVLGDSFHTAKSIVSYAQRKKKKILFNPSLYLAQKGKNSLKPILSATTILALNHQEAQALLHTTSNSTLELLIRLHHLGPSIVIITNGAKALHAFHDQQIYTLTPPQVPVVHTAGAGDAFTAGFLAGYIKGYSFVDALRVGQANASSVIGHIGAKNRLLTELEANRWIEKYKMKVTIIKL